MRARSSIGQSWHAWYGRFHTTALLLIMSMLENSLGRWRHFMQLKLTHRQLLLLLLELQVDLVLLLLLLHG